MNASIPHYLLFSEAIDGDPSGRWRLKLRSADGALQFEADEIEPATRGERLALLAVVRGLEALDQPSRVTLVTSSAYVREGIRHGVSEWRRNGWCWEFFGQMVPVKNRDLWRRIDRAMSFHDVECRTRNWRFDPPHLSELPRRFACLPCATENAARSRAGNTGDQDLSAGSWPVRLAVRWTRWKRQIGESLSALVYSPRFG